MPLSSGFRLGPYEIVAALGAGGMGEVYRATDGRLHRDVALKVLPEGFAHDGERLARFEREARAVAALSHPNILSIFDFGVQDGLPYAVMELLEGETLRDRLTRGALSIRNTIQWGVLIARGLAAAHDKGLVHRDLKPENIFLLRDGQLKILDFGLARLVVYSARAATATPTSAAITDAGMVMGTPGYMAPEQVRGEAVDARSDLFALGLVLFEMISGKRAFQRDTAAETMAAIITDDPGDLITSRPETPPALERITRHCFEKNPLERFQSARDVAFALEALSGSGTSSPVAVRGSKTPGWMWAGWAATVIGLVVLGALGWTAIHTDSPLPQFTRRTFDRELITNARFLPSRRSILYSAMRTGRHSEVFELPDTSAVPRSIGRGRLLSVSSSGEVAVLLEDVPSASWMAVGTLARMTADEAPRPVTTDVTAADWSPDGSAFAIVRRVDGLDWLEYPIGKVLLKSTARLSDIRVSPDGQHVLYMEHDSEADDRGWLKVVDAAGAVTTLGGEFYGEQGAAWSSDGRQVLFSVGAEGGAMSIHALSVAGAVSASAQPTPVVATPQSFIVMDVDRDGRILAVTDERRFGVGVRLASDGRYRDLSWLDQSWSPSLSRDGSYVVFTDGSVLGYATVLRRTDGSPVVRLGDGATMGMSPDGKWAVAAIHNVTPQKLVAYPTGAGKPIQFPSGPLEAYYAEIPAVWMPDSQSFLFWASEPGRAARTYLQTLSGGDPKPLLPDRVRAVLSSPDGRYIIGAEADGIWNRYPVGGGKAIPVRWLEPTTEFRITDNINGGGDFPVAWSDDGRALVVRSGGAALQLDRVDLTSGRRTSIGEVNVASGEGMRWTWVGTASASGAQYAYSYVSRASTLFVVTNRR